MAGDIVTKAALAAATALGRLDMTRELSTKLPSDATPATHAMFVREMGLALNAFRTASEQLVRAARWQVENADG